MSYSNKPENFPLGTWVTWRNEKSSSWIKLLTSKFGPGPFQVMHTEYGMYGTPKVTLANRHLDMLLFYGDGQDLFDKSWLEECPISAGSP